MRVGNLALAPLRRLTGAAQSVLGSNQVRPVARSLYTFVGVFRGQRIETLREVSSDEEEHNTQPRLLWPDDGNDSDDFYDTDDENEHQQHCHAGPSEADYASDSLSVPEHDRHSQNDENQYSDQYAHRLDEHDTLAPQEDADRSSLPSSRQLFGDDHHSENTLSGDESGDQESTPQGCWQDNQEHDTRAVQEDADRATRSSKRQLFTNDDHHSQNTFSGDDSESQNATLQGRRLNNQEHDARAVQEDTDRATRPSKRQLFKNDDHDSQNILSGDNSDGGESTRQGYEPTSPVQGALTMQENRECTPNQPLFNYDDRHSRNTPTQDDCEAEESTQQGYWPDSPAFYGGPIESTSVEWPPLHARNGNHRPQEIERGYRSETVITDMASLPNNGNRYYADEEFMTPVTDRPRRNRTTPPIADGFDSDDESDDYHAIGHAASPSNASARRPLQVITQKESYNPFIHIPEPQNAEAVHRERARRRAEARDNLGYVIRGQKYLIYPSLYEESEDPELYGSTVLWPSESTRNDADFTFSCPSTQNPGASEVDEDDEDDDGTTLLPIPKRTQVISDTSQADTSEDEYDHHPEIRSGDSLARPLQIRARPSRTVIDLSVGEDENEDAAPTEAVEEDRSTQSSATIRIADSWLGSNKRSSEDTQPERASKVLIGHSRQSSFAGPFEALKERATVERGGPSQPIFDFSVSAMPVLPRAEEEPKWYRLSKSTVTTRIDPRENLAFTIPTALPGSAKQTPEDTAPERRSTILMNQSRWPSCAGPFDAASEQVGVATEQGSPIQATFDFSVGEMPALPKAEEEPRWYRLSKSTTTVRTDPREGVSSGTQDGGRPSGSHRGYGSSTYGSGDEDSDSGALNRSFDFEFKPEQPLSEATTSRPTKGHGLVILRPEKHRLEPDICDVQDDAGGGGGGEHACSAFDRCWGRRRPVVGLYYWDDEEWSEDWVERRKDKRYVRIRDPANDD
ncbi:hypothetical protein KVV02_002407 [Mortierella alpina]|uniref:Uncharacterized protein n=1 Tax=Mortierella alpina TaxID=64518 RepID=A0A9P8A009_MORAP|nr:hypothetical protein KVV02_002407 [Mortierella alpina]